LNNYLVEEAHQEEIKEGFYSKLSN